jgi:transcriptional regulator with XRE-family HTH domain
MTMTGEAKPAQDRTKELVLSKATLRAAEHLDLSGKALAEVLGLSEATVSRMKTGQYHLAATDKAFELAALFVRLFRSLDAITGGDDESSRSWLRAQNTVLRAQPIDLIRSVRGLLETVMYVDSRRAKI